MHIESDLETVEVQRFQCRHIFTDGHRCGSPALRSENFCYFHHTARRVAGPRRSRAQTSTVPHDLIIAMPEDRAALLLSIGQVLQGLANRTIDRKDAGLMLYGLQVANSALPRESLTAPGPARANLRTQPRRGLRQHPAPGDLEKLGPVEETVFDEDLGILAQPAEFLEPEEKEERKSLGRRMLEELEEYEERERERESEAARREEIELAVATAHQEAFANIQELVEAVKATAIAETEARLRAEFNQPQPAAIPVIQATDSGPLIPSCMKHAWRSPRSPHVRTPLCIGRQRRADVSERRTDLGSQPLDRRNRTQTNEGRHKGVFD